MLRLARSAVRWWWAVIALWVLATVGLELASPPFSDVAVFDEAAFLPADTPSIEGGMLVAEGWPDDDFSRTAALVLVRDDSELMDADITWLEELVAWLRSDAAPDVVVTVTTHLDDPDLTSSFVAEDGRAAFVLAGLSVSPYSPPSVEAVEAMRAHLAAEPPPDGAVPYVTGSAGVAADEDAAVERSVARTHVLTLGLVIVILLIVYRSPITPLVPLATIGVAYLVARSLVSLLAQAGMDVASLFETFAIVLVFGAGTDYCLFLVSRYHDELGLATEAGFPSTRRIRGGTLAVTLTVLAGVIGSSAATTIVGFSAQSFARFGLYRTMGPAMAIAIAVTLLASLTLAPALLRLLGPIAFWPDRGSPSHATGGGGSSLLVARHTELGLPAPQHEPVA